MLDFVKIYKYLGYTFSDSQLLIEALSHRSYGETSYERLEFLGDAILDFIIASELFIRYPDLQEGELSGVRAGMVNEENLAKKANELHLGEYLILGKGERQSGGAERASILSDCFEAVVAAIYLDSGIEVCQKKVNEWFASCLDDITLVEQKGSKSILQEYLQANKMAIPVYKLVAVTGKRHAQVFKVECGCKDLDFKTQGSGSNRQAAEKDAAREFFRILQEKKENE